MSSVMEIAMREMGQLIELAKANLKVLPGPIINVSGYGAIGDGVTDDTDFVQAAVNYGLENGMSTIFFPHGKTGEYYVTGLIGAENMVFVGDNAKFVGGYSGTINTMGGDAALKADLLQRAINVKNPPAPLVAAVGDGITNDTAAIQACINWLAAAGGGILLFPKGSYLVSSALTVTKSIIFRGVGRGVSITTTTSLSNDLFKVDADYVVFEDLQIINQASGTRTAGAGIKLSTGVHASINRVLVKGFYYGLHAVSSSSYFIGDSYFVSNHKYEIYIQNVASPDTGDQTIMGCTFDESTGAMAAIRHESGGGLKLIGNKILHHDYGYDLQVADGVNTSVLTIGDNSIEAQRISSVRLGRLGTTGNYSKIAISGNQFSSPSSIIIGDGIIQVNTSGNIHSGDTTNPAIQLNGGEHIFVSGENINYYSKGVVVSSNVFYVQIGKNRYKSTPILVESLAAATREVNVDIDHLSLFTITSNSVYTNLYRLEMAQYRGVEIEIIIEGILQGSGGFVRKISKLISRASGACSVTDVTDVAAGAVIDVQFDVTTTSGSVLVGLKRSTGAGGTSIDGNLIIKTSGNVARVVKL